ncbi:hypothetical protein [Aeromonas salmonicida]|uniref:hypothetical protein n=1 Tax=Aeromonas salmonicida TaxID=645 RepID=UPI0039A5702B
MVAGGLINIGNEPVACRLVPKKALNFLGGKPIEIKLEGALLALDGESASFYVDRPETA